MGLPEIKRIGGNFKSNKGRHYLIEYCGIGILGLYIHEINTIYIVKQKSNKLLEYMVLFHELCHWFVRKFLKNTDKYNGIVDKYIKL